jgi:hypothetical protein
MPAPFYFSHLPKRERLAVGPGLLDDGHQIDLNQTYGLPTRVQPPMAARLGLEVSF